MPDRSKGKRRRGAQQQGRSPKTSSAATGPVTGIATASRLPGLPWLVVGVITLVILIVAFVVFRSSSTTPIGAAPSTDPGSSPIVAAGCPTSEPAALPAGETRTVTITTPEGVMTLKIQADLSPIAAGNFVALASCGFYDGTVFHRTPTLQDGTPFVIQGGDPEGIGSGGPGYTITDEPVTTPYKRGTVAMARTSAPNSVGSQFFIVLDDKDGPILSSANTYQIIGDVTSGMDVADAIFVASGGVELPENPIPITTATVTNP